jgi:hypothetical protein
MSDLVLDLKGNLGLCPEVIGYLASIKEYEYYYTYYKLRHPGGIFNIALSYVIDDYLELLKELEEYQNNFENFYKDNKKMTLGIKLKNLINDIFVCV